MVGAQVARQAPEVVEDAQAVGAGEDGALASVTRLAVVDQRLLTQKHHLPKGANTTLFHFYRKITNLPKGEKNN